jgi:hypothetical protein
MEEWRRLYLASLSAHCTMNYEPNKAKKKKRTEGHKPNIRYKTMESNFMAKRHMKNSMILPPYTKRFASCMRVAYNQMLHFWIKSKLVVRTER